jgi:putative acetyltransferase
MYVQIRREAAGDEAAIYTVNRLAFAQDAEAGLVDALRHDDAFIPELSLVADAGTDVVGHILFTRIVIEDEPGTAQPSLALAPMAVLPEFQQQGIGGQLIRAGLERARALGHRSVIVLGHETYYPKFGFRPASGWGIRAPFPVPDAAFMAIELVPGGLDRVHGLVRYAAPFMAV